VYQPQANGGGIAGLLANAIVAAMTKAAPNYIPLAHQANNGAINLKGTGLPQVPTMGFSARTHRTTSWELPPTAAACLGNSAGAISPVIFRSQRPGNASCPLPFGFS